MYKIITLTFLIFSQTCLIAQNMQLHYDFGKGRKYLTSTVEMFRPDKYGSTFFFIDMDYQGKAIKGVSLAYWEIARALKFWENPLAFHVEYNGGLGQYEDHSGNKAFTINNSWLTGFELSIDASNFSRGFTIQALYKYIQGKQDFSFQLTGVWYLNFLNDKFSFNGFADFWREDMSFELSNGKIETTKFIFQAEPQIWYNFTRNFAAGSEFEVSNNFAGKGFYIMPTLGIKATF